MADFEERHLKISFDELNRSLDNCIKVLKALYNRKFNEYYKIKSQKDGISIKKFEICLNEYSHLRKEFQNQNFCYNENLCGHFDKEAAENVHLRKEALQEIRDKLYLLGLVKSNEIKGRTKIANLLWVLKKQIELTMPFKIYALSDFSSALPYSVPEEELAESSYEFDAKKTGIKWHFVGFAENIFEAWYYVQHDTYSGVNPEMGCEPVRHLLSEPSDEGYNSFVKIESEYYTEYFDLYAPKPIGQRFGYRKTEAVCFFCGKKVEGHGKDIYPLNYMSDKDCVFNRACDECHEKFVEPLKYRCLNDKEREEKQEKMSKLRVLYCLEKPEFEEEGKSK